MAHRDAARRQGAVDGGAHLRQTGRLQPVSRLQAAQQAPTVSTTVMAYAGSLASSPDAARQVTPRAPRVTTVSPAPSAAHPAITCEGDWPG